MNNGCIHFVEIWKGFLRQDVRPCGIEFSVIESHQELMNSFLFKHQSHSLSTLTITCECQQCLVCSKFIPQRFQFCEIFYNWEICLFNQSHLPLQLMYPNGVTLWVSLFKINPYGPGYVCIQHRSMKCFIYYIVKPSRYHRITFFPGKCLWACVCWLCHSSIHKSKLVFGFESINN